MRVFAYLGLGIVFCCATVHAESPSDKPVSKTKSDTSAELDAIRQATLEFEKAFNRGDAKAVAAHWTKDGDYLTETGESFVGREAIEQEYESLLAGKKKHQIKIVIDRLRLLSDGAAVEDGRAIIDPPPPGAPAITKYTAVHVKEGDKWLMSTVRDTRVETPSAYYRVADLEWLIGTWVAEENGSRTESVCRWVANKSFVERSYKVTHADHSESSGIQLIGFNPEGGHIQSWNFSSDGGYAVGIWSARKNGWSADVTSTMANGTKTSATNLLIRLDDDAYTWQSVNRKAGDAALPDTTEVVLKRQAN